MEKIYGNISQDDDKSDWNLEIFIGQSRWLQISSGIAVEAYLRLGRQVLIIYVYRAANTSYFLEVK